MEEGKEEIEEVDGEGVADWRIWGVSTARKGGRLGRADERR